MGHATMDEIETWRIATDLVEKHGAEGAIFQAASQADNCQWHGDPAKAHDWLVVLDAVERFVRPIGACELAH